MPLRVRSRIFPRPHAAAACISALVLAAAVACAGAGGAAQQAGPSPRVGATIATDVQWNLDQPVPKLVVFVAIDQFRAEYLQRFQRQLTGGLGRLLRGGAVFLNAFQDHGITETAPGHSTMLSGRFPWKNGIVQNDQGVPDTQYPLVGANGTGASPFRFRGSVLIDWMRVSDPRSRALSVSRKDRAAILPIGRAAQEAYWYAGGSFVTSRYYHDTLPDWVKQFNARGIPTSAAGRAWTLLLPENEYPEPDSVPVEHAGRDFVFPHVLNADPARARGDFIQFPWMDNLILDFALEGLQTLGLGNGPATDLLSVSLSTTDAVGHRYGPDSRELHDQVLRADRALGAFLDSLYRLRDSSSIIVAFTSDHGVTSFPPSRDRQVTLTPVISAVQQGLQQRGLGRGIFSFDQGVVYADPIAFRRAGVDLDSVGRAFAAQAREVAGVERVDFYRDLLAADTVHDAVARRWLHMFPPDVPVLLTVTLTSGTIWRSSDAQHGSPHDIDANVPVIFYGAPFAPGRYTDTVRVVDLAPTVAWALHIMPTEPLDGRVLRRALRAPSGG